MQTKLEKGRPQPSAKRLEVRRVPRSRTPRQRPAKIDDPSWAGIETDRVGGSQGIHSRRNGKRKPPHRRGRGRTPFELSVVVVRTGVEPRNYLWTPASGRGVAVDEN